MFAGQKLHLLENNPKNRHLVQNLGLAHLPLAANATPMPNTPSSSSLPKNSGLESSVKLKLNTSSLPSKTEEPVTKKPKITDFSQNLPKSSSTEPIRNPKIKEPQPALIDLKDFKETHKTNKRSDPLVTLSSYLDSCLQHTKKIPYVQENFLKPVNKDLVPDYYKIITDPIALSDIKIKIDKLSYRGRQAFRDDYKLMLSNCLKYNGQFHTLTKVAEKMLETVDQFMASNVEAITNLEQQINPLFNTNPIIKLNKFLSQEILDFRLLNIENSSPFKQKVSEKETPDYYKIITRPMDLSKIKSRCENGMYKTAAEFLADVELILKNSERYNGLQHVFTVKAREIFEKGKEGVEQFKETIVAIEKEIRRSNDNDEMDVGLDLSDESDDN